MKKGNQKTQTTNRAPFPRLTSGQCRKIHEASLEILERIGIRIDLPEAKDLLQKAGAKIDEKSRTHIPPHLVEQALKTAPKEVILFDRQGDPAIDLSGHRCFYGPGSDCLNIIDHRSGERRKPQLRDVQEAVRLCDALPNINFVMSMLLPEDVDTAIADRYQMEAMLTSTTKPIIFVAYDYEGCVDCVEMAEAAAGSAEDLQKKPNIACYINVISGLWHNQESLQKLLYLSSKNLPAVYIPSSTAGVTSPVTPAGAMALDYAGTLTGVVLSQLRREGAPIIISGMPPGHLDMRTLVSTYCEPERGLAQALAHSLRLPMFSLGGAAEAKVPDQQAAAEAALSLMVETLAGGHLIHDLGYLESGLTFSLAQLTVCDEIVSWIKGFLKEFELSEESLALDTIAEVGPEGQFLDKKHTRNHYRSRWYPRLFERENYDTWAQKGEKTLIDRASERVEQLLSEHQPDPLSAAIQKKICQTVLRAETKKRITQ